MSICQKEELAKDAVSTGNRHYNKTVRPSISTTPFIAVYQKVFGTKYLSAVGSTVLHVFLEGFSLVDGLAWILIDLGFHISGIILSSHGPSELGSISPVSLSVEDGSGLAGESRGRCERRSGRNHGKDSNKLVLQGTTKKRENNQVKRYREDICRTRRNKFNLV